jgi:hypothetical protein
VLAHHHYSVIRLTLFFITQISSHSKQKTTVHIQLKQTIITMAKTPRRSLAGRMFKKAVSKKKVTPSIMPKRSFDSNGSMEVVARAKPRPLSRGRVFRTKRNDNESVISNTQGGSVSIATQGDAITVLLVLDDSNNLGFRGFAMDGLSAAGENIGKSLEKGLGELDETLQTTSTNVSGSIANISESIANISESITNVSLATCGFLVLAGGSRAIDVLNTLPHQSSGVVTGAVAMFLYSVMCVSLCAPILAAYRILSTTQS